jgi:sugar lactone lactonase YvrE/thiol-disulfide isomerase/thioredoxin
MIHSLIAEEVGMKPGRLLAGALVVVALVVLGALFVSAQDDEARFVGTVVAPEFPTGVDWLNVDQPLTLADLEGKVVLLDFWTYGCINCIHMIPVLDALKTRYPDELVVIGVHSAKFDNEGQTGNIAQIIERYNLRHPVINDSDFVVWGAYRPYGVNAWPTFALIDPRGGLVAVQSGEIPFDAFDQFIGGMIAHFDPLGEIDRTPIELSLVGAGDPGTPLRFPGKVLADLEGRRLFIADSGHNRIVIADIDTFEVQAIIGSGAAGLADGDFATAQFNQPQGMALDGDTLYVADVSNHAIRAVDLAQETVRTIAGTGRKGSASLRPGQPITDLADFDLRSPWDVTMGPGGQLYIAMAGSHQLAVLDLGAGTLAALVGNGREAQLNSTLLESELAQPSGLYLDGNRLYFADSESSTIRVANLAADSVAVVAGTLANNLFDYGDIDGPLGENRLQHALGVVGAPDGALYIADTYNSRIRRVDPATGDLETLFGLGGAGGYADGDATVAQFDEPGGLDFAESKLGGVLFVADTNNHAIRVIDLEAGSVSTVAFPNVADLVMAPVTVIGGNSALGETITLPAQTVNAGAGTVVLNLALPEGYKINDLTASTLRLESAGVAVDAPGEPVAITARETRVPLALEAGEETLRATMTLFYCLEGDEGLCFIDEVEFVAPLTIVAAGGEANEVRLERAITPPRQSSPLTAPG